MYRFRFTRQQLPQNKLQDAAVGVVQRFLRRIDANERLEFRHVSARAGTHLDSARRSKLLDYLLNSDDLEYFLSRDLQRLGCFAGQELQRQDAHADKIGAVNALVTLSNDRTDAEQQRPFCSPVP